MAFVTVNNTKKKVCRVNYSLRHGSPSQAFGNNSEWQEITIYNVDLLEGEELSDYIAEADHNGSLTYKFMNCMQSEGATICRNQHIPLCFDIGAPPRNIEYSYTLFMRNELLSSSWTSPSETITDTIGNTSTIDSSVNVEQLWNYYDLGNNTPFVLDDVYRVQFNFNYYIYNTMSGNFRSLVFDANVIDCCECDVQLMFKSHLQTFDNVILDCPQITYNVINEYIKMCKPCGSDTSFRHSRSRRTEFGKTFTATIKDHTSQHLIDCLYASAEVYMICDDQYYAVEPTSTEINYKQARKTGFDYSFTIYPQKAIIC